MSAMAFSDKGSLCNTHMECWNLTKYADDDFFTYSGVVNHKCANFKTQELTRCMYKSLIFVRDLMTTEDKNIRARVLSKTKQANQELTQQSIAAES